MRRMVMCTSSSGLDYLEKPDNIKMLRHHVEIYDKDYLDGLTISADDLARLMNKDKDLLPTTLPPTVEEILAEFEALYEEGCQEVFVICISAKISDTYNNIRVAKDAFDKDMFIHIVDSRTFAYSEAMLALEVAEMLKQNKTSLEISQRLETLRNNNSLWFVIEDIRNLIRTKRISAPAGFVANLLSIKPLLEIDEEGEIVTLEKVRKIERAIDYMCDIAVETHNEKPGKMYLINTGSDNLVDEVAERLSDRGIQNLPVYPTASTAIANHGPAGVGIGILHDC